MPIVVLQRKTRRDTCQPCLVVSVVPPSFASPSPALRAGSAHSTLMYDLYSAPLLITNDVRVRSFPACVRSNHNVLCLCRQGEEAHAVQPTLRERCDRCGREAPGPQLQRRQGLRKPIGMLGACARTRWVVGSKTPCRSTPPEGGRSMTT